MTDPLPNSAKKSPSRPRAFRRRIFILLGVLVVLIVIALVGAQTIGDPCDLYQKISNPQETAPGNEFTGGVPSGWRFARFICDQSLPREIPNDPTKPPVPSETTIKPIFEDDDENLEIIVTNKTNKHYFVPYKTKKELASFAQWATSADANDKVSLCVKDKAVTDTTTIADGGYSAMVDGCGVEAPKKVCTVTELRGQRCAAKAGVTFKLSLRA